MQELHRNVGTKQVPLIVHPAQADLVFGSTSQDSGKLQSPLWAEEMGRGEERGSTSCFTVSCCHGGSWQGQIAVLLLRSQGILLQGKIYELGKHFTWASSGSSNHKWALLGCFFLPLLRHCSLWGYWCNFTLRKGSVHVGGTGRNGGWGPK